VKVLITGAQGMLGRTLQQRWGADHEIIPTDRTTLDITVPGSCDAKLASTRPDVVVHCAAFTAVDRCEGEAAQAFLVNQTGSAHLATACTRHQARLIAISTDYVFSGELDRPYHEADAVSPRTVYGRSKAAGEQAVAATCADHCIVRVGWLYGPGGPSFLHTILRIAAKEGPPLRVVDDQIGNPTSTDAVASALLPLLDGGITGIVHMTCSGASSWYTFATALLRQYGVDRAVAPCTTAEFPRPAPRPANSRLEKRALRQHGLPDMPDWQESLERFTRAYPKG
jgi:dTDP-4-dehydrorhamnose reductase